MSDRHEPGTSDRHEPGTLIGIVRNPHSAEESLVQIKPVQSFVLSCEQVPGTPQPSEFVEEFVQPDGGPRLSLEMESSRRVVCSGARCWRKRSVCEIPFRKIVLELGIPIGSDVFVEKIQQSLDFRRQP
jgi:hypothetical protein